MVLVGNKADLMEKREVAQEEANQLVKAWGNCMYLETSAKECSNVNEAFLALLRSIIADKQRKFEKTAKPEPVKTCCIIC